MADTLIRRTLIDVSITGISMFSIIVMGLIAPMYLNDTFEMRQYLGHIEQTAAMYDNSQIKLIPPNDVTRITFNQDEIILILKDGTQITHKLVRENIIKDAYIEEETGKIVILT